MGNCKLGGALIGPTFDLLGSYGVTHGPIAVITTNAETIIIPMMIIHPEDPLLVKEVKLDTKFKRSRFTRFIA